MKGKKNFRKTDYLRTFDRLEYFRKETDDNFHSILRLNLILSLPRGGLNTFLKTSRKK